MRANPPYSKMARQDMTGEIAWFGMGIKTTAPKTCSFFRVLAGGAGVDTMILLKVFRNLLELHRNVHPAALPTTWAHSDLGIVFMQSIPSDQDGIHPIEFQEHILDHGLVRRTNWVHI